ncbi:hypothetical protein T03_9878 [Trichinella britovi]|uniref:Integrase zinc-binding domain-containing protein n=1 Tax=Trichinella britovi TaxID=45882 RepID=A0A0V1C8L6_TRIBR|nr:hypothetical protein T03_9878 [Trichinella britovi]
MKRLQEFSPFLDEFCIQRFGGRLGRAHLDGDTKYPALLPHRGPYLRQLHAGVEQTHAAFRERFWILRGRSTVKRVLRGCTTCQRVSPPPCQQRMSELPEMRVEAAGPFVNVGPLLIRGHSPNRLMQKGYACIFSYIVVRAIHLELFPPCAAQVHHTAWTTGYHAVRQLPDPPPVEPLLAKRLRRSELESRLTAPGHGTHQMDTVLLEHASRCEGYWKRLLRSVKLALRKTVGRSLLTFDELQTVLCEVEARINDRPLTLVSSVAQDELALNPAQFLIGWSLATLPDGNGGARSTGMKHLLRRRAHQKKVIAHLWKRWRRERRHESETSYSLVILAHREAAGLSAVSSKFSLELMDSLSPLVWKLQQERSAGPSVHSPCSSQQRDGDGHCASGGSLLEIL